MSGITDSAAPQYSDFDLTTKEQLDMIQADIDDDLFSVLMAHRPEYFELYAEYDCDLVLSGHAHGGQWRVPGLINGVFVPNQGLFPQYTGGRYIVDDTEMLLGRGLANNGGKVPRIFNPPELLVIDIKGK